MGNVSPDAFIVVVRRSASTAKNAMCARSVEEEAFVSMGGLRVDARNVGGLVSVSTAEGSIAAKIVVVHQCVSTGVAN